MYTQVLVVSFALIFLVFIYFIIRTMCLSFDNRPLHYNSPAGMLSSHWGPAAWKFLHMVTLGYPVEANVVE